MANYQVGFQGKDSPEYSIQVLLCIKKIKINEHIFNSVAGTRANQFVRSFWEGIMSISSRNPSPKFGELGPVDGVTFFSSRNKTNKPKYAREDENVTR